MKKMKLIFVSIDAMTGEELSELLTMPNASRLAGGARVQRVRSVYPTLTYPCHAAMLTGCFPERTGIANNLVFAPGVRPAPWHWERDHNREPDDLLFAAKRAGLSTASVFWPGTGRHPGCDWLIPEYWPQGAEDSAESAMARMGSSPEVLKILREYPCQDLSSHPQADAAAVTWACEILRRFCPDVLLLHPANLDEVKHLYGARGPHIRQALRETDTWLGWIFDVVSANGDEAVTNFVLTSDHGQLDVSRIFSPNVLLKEMGLIRARESATAGASSFLDWDAFCLPAGMCFEVRLKNPEETAARERMRALLAGWKQYGVTRIYEVEEAEIEEHLSGAFSFFCEMDGKTAVSGSISGEALRPRRGGDAMATHGYHPDRGPQPCFFCKGPAFRNGAEIAESSLTDEAPTVAAALRISLPDAQGRVLTELLR
ncbi:MAG: ectonucleotide pyrophosphatase/phosphodiesterase [Clostridiales bacterium]|nr:ectonucleotide pyrophosphatase/phosphodiesterase [Clostridiales bacterium]